MLRRRERDSRSEAVAEPSSQSRLERRTRRSRFSRAIRWPDGVRARHCLVGSPRPPSTTRRRNDRAIPVASTAEAGGRLRSGVPPGWSAATGCARRCAPAETRCAHAARCRGMVSHKAAVPHRERVLPRREERIELRAHKRGGVISALAGSTGASGRHRRLRVRPRPGRSGALTPREAGILARPSRGGSQASVRRSWLGRSSATPRVTRDSPTTGARTSVARSSAGFPWTSSG